MKNSDQLGRLTASDFGFVSEIIIFAFERGYFVMSISQLREGVEHDKEHVVASSLSMSFIGKDSLSVHSPSTFPNIINLYFLSLGRH